MTNRGVASDIGSMDEQEDDEVRRQERVRLSVRRRNYEKDTPIELQAPRPSAYAYYKKLVQDFENLDTELQEQHATQERLQADLQRNKAKYEAHDRERRQRERQEWERRRDRDLEEICEQSNVLEKIRHEYSELEEEELRLQAELEVLQEKQHEANQTEAHRISKLVHDRGSILDEEFAKGRMDIEFITKIVATANREKQEQRKKDIGLHAVVDSIQQRRQDAFREAAARFQERLHSFELEREALRQKSDETKWKKQRALKILSTNQQEVIKGFFVTPREALNEVNAPLPVLDFGSILDTLSQSGDTVRRLQGEDDVQQSARRQLNDALSEAKRNLELGPQKLDELQQRMRQREQEAQRLERLLPSAETPYDGRWSVETYSKDQLSIVYNLRTLIFRWIEEAVEMARCQPERSLLEMEIRRAEQTRVAFAAQEQRDRTIRAAVAVQIEWIDEVIEENVRSIHQELSYSVEQVRSVINNASIRLFFPSLNDKDGEMKPAKASATPPGDPAPTLRWAMFDSTWDELKSQRKRISMTRPSKVLLMQPVPRDIAESASQLNTSSPKKRGGFFGAKKNTTDTSKQFKSEEKGAENSIPLSKPPVEQIPTVSTVIPQAAAAASRAEVTCSEEKALWSSLHHDNAEFSSLSSLAWPSCVELSCDGRLLAVGTLDGELIVWSLLPKQTPIAIRTWSSSSSKSSSKSRITRILFNRNSTRVLTLNLLKSASLFSFQTPNKASHSTTSFQPEPEKFKPIVLEPPTPLSASELLQEPQYPTRMLEQDVPTMATKLKSLPRPTLSAIGFFPSLSPLGGQDSLLCGVSNGDMMRAYLEHADVTSASGLRWLTGESQAAFDAPLPADTALHAPISRIRREIFRGVHQQMLLFVGGLPPSGACQSRLVSVDKGAVVALWEYNRDYFSGCGWFTPRVSCQLDLAKGEMLQLALTTTRDCLVIMLFHSDASVASNKKPSGRIRFVQLDLSNGVSLIPVPLEVELVGAIPPRFATLSMETSPTVVSQIRHFLVLLMNNSLRVYSLLSGNECTLAIPLAREKASTQVYNLVTSVSTMKKIKPTRRSRGKSTSETTIGSVVVASEQHRQIRMYQFKHVTA